MNFFSRVLNKLKGVDPVYIDDDKYRIQNYLRENPVILEAGAFDGKDTLQMASLWPNAKIHTFEPVPQLFKALQNKLSAVKNVHVYPYALSDRTGPIDLYISSGMSAGSSSILSPLKHLDAHPEVKFENKQKVEAYTIDDWAKKNEITSVDLMWLDMQGAEYRVLASCPEILKTVKVLFTEVSLIETYKEVLLYPEFKKWLEKQGFEVVMEDLPHHDMGNVLFVRK
jgi:FkbM family methyltransferase